MSQQRKRDTKNFLSLRNKNRRFTCVLYAYSQFLCSLARFDLANRGCASDSPAAHILCSTAHMRQDISAASFCSCKLLWRSDEQGLQEKSF